MSVWDDADPERRIYTDPSNGTHDPLRLRRALVEASQGKVWNLLAERRKAIDAMHAAQGDLGRVGAADLELARVEPPLVLAARKAFGLGADECQEAEVLRHLDDFVGWLEGKGPRSG